MKRSTPGFTLVEVLVALSIFFVMVTFLISISGQAANIWRRQQDLSSIRERARAALDMIGSELQVAVLPPDLKAQNSVQLIVNPDGVTSEGRDSIFWFAPIAAAEDEGNLAKVGYFIRKIDGRYLLCRLYVPSSDANFRLYSHPTAWVNDSLLTSVAPATEASKYRGLFLEDVAGIWVNAYDEAGNLLADPDTRTDHRLPARIDVSLVFLDTTGAELAKGVVELPDVSGSETAQEYLKELAEETATEVLVKHAGAVSISINFQSRKR